LSTFSKTFPQTPVFLAVIHVEHLSQAARNAQIAQDEGADGIFLINHSLPALGLVECYNYIHEKQSDFWIGLNCLDLGMSAVDFVPKTTAGLWIDNAGISEDEDPVAAARTFAERRRRSGWQGIYFGGVAFKYQDPVDDVAEAARLAVPFVDVITTSGEGTGEAADVSKIRQMKETIGRHPLAIASGITPENVAEYLPWADCLLVATGVSDSHTELNPSRVRALVRAMGK